LYSVVYGEKILIVLQVQDKRLSSSVQRDSVLALPIEAVELSHCLSLSLASPGLESRMLMISMRHDDDYGQ
jgi:hypothetical protein